MKDFFDLLLRGDFNRALESEFSSMVIASGCAMDDQCYDCEFVSCERHPINTGTALFFNSGVRIGSC